MNKFKWQDVYSLNKSKTKQNKKLLQGNDQMAGATHGLLTRGFADQVQHILAQFCFQLHSRSPLEYTHDENHVFLSLACNISNIPNGELREEKRTFQIDNLALSLFVMEITIVKISKMDPLVNVMAFHQRTFSKQLRKYLPQTGFPLIPAVG